MLSEVPIHLNQYVVLVPDVIWTPVCEWQALNHCLPEKARTVVSLPPPLKMSAHPEIQSSKFVAYNS